MVTNFLFIYRSIVQTSGAGPVLFIIFVADLHTLCSHNILFKYADDTTLIFPQTADICIKLLNFQTSSAGLNAIN